MRGEESRGRRATIRRLGAVMVMAVAGTLAQHASASSLTLKFDGMYFGSSSLSARTSVTGQSAFYAGAMRWYEQGNPSNTFITFCTEVTQTVQTTSLFTTSHLKSAPVPGSGMGEYRAGLIQDLYNKYWQNATASRTESAAFQLAIWEIAYEDNIIEGGDALSVLVGDFRATGGQVASVQDGFGMTAAQLADSWLATLESVDVTNLVALTNPNGQDQIIMIPLPPAVAMAGLGLLIGGVARRRMMAAS